MLISLVTNAPAQPNWGTTFADAIQARYQPTIDVMTQKGWDHSNSIILHGMEKIYQKTQNPSYLEYVRAFVDSLIDEQGNITGLQPELDRIHPGVLCLFLFEKTGEPKYRLAAKNLRDYLITGNTFRTTPDGGYWHKNNDHYENVVTVDGIYMAYPFLVKYGVTFDDMEAVDVATSQTLFTASRTFNIDTRLPYHGWDYSKQKSWAHPITGTSSQVWSRCVGWFAMALSDILEYLPATHVHYGKIVLLYQQLATGIGETQNKEDGLWYQMISNPGVPGNYPETSGSGMIIYALKKGIKQGWLDASFNRVTDKAWQNLTKHIDTHSDGLPRINSFNPGMGIQDSLEDYLAVRPVSCPSPDLKQHPHGYCGILMAASVMEE